ncbi:(deoxy)nucleoside triphosphate pyrophosphohydrolase [Actinokineospora sp. NPDC004072]
MRIPLPPRAVAAALTETEVLGACGGGRLLVPGEDVHIGGHRLRVVHLDADGLRAVPVGRALVAVDVGVVAVDGDTELSVAVRGPRAWAHELMARIAHRAAVLAEARVVVGTAVLRDGQVLAQQRAYPPEAAGLWEFPGGRVEPGESDADAVRRECREELGIEVLPNGTVGPDVVLADDLVLRLYTAHAPHGTPRPNDHQALAWLTEHTLDTVPWLPADRVLIPALRARLAQLR